MTTVQPIRPDVDTPLDQIPISPRLTVKQIAALCAHLSGPTGWVYVRVESVKGKPVAYLVRELPDESIPPFLRRQAD